MTEQTLTRRLDGEPYGDYYARLLDASHKADEARRTHETWKRRHWDGITREDCEHRILVVLRELLKSDFFRANYFDTGVPKADCERAHAELEQMGFTRLDEPVEGADWKYALFCRVLRKRGERRILIDTEAAGLYIDEMQGELNPDAVEAFFRFAMFTRLAYEEIDRMGSKPTASKHDKPELTPKQQAVAEFVESIIRLGNMAYGSWHGKRVRPSVHKPEVEIVIRKDELAELMRRRAKSDFEELASVCYPVTANTKRDMCRYVAALQADGYFGELPNKMLAQVLAPIVGLSAGTVNNYLSQS